MPGRIPPVRPAPSAAAVFPQPAKSQHPVLNFITVKPSVRPELQTACARRRMGRSRQLLSFQRGDEILAEVFGQIDHVLKVLLTAIIRIWYFGAAVLRAIARRKLEPVQQLWLWTDPPQITQILLIHREY